ncbi:hypothetical protein ACWUKX_20670 [Mesorhizobium sp. f-mel]
MFAVAWPDGQFGICNDEISRVHRDRQHRQCRQHFPQALPKSVVHFLPPRFGAEMNRDGNNLSRQAPGCDNAFAKESAVTCRPARYSMTFRLGDAHNAGRRAQL